MVFNSYFAIDSSMADYINYLAIIFSQIDFLPAIFVIMGMGLAYTR